MTAKQVKRHFSRRNLQEVQYVQEFGDIRLFVGKNKNSVYFISVDLRGETEPQIEKLFSTP